MNVIQAIKKSVEGATGLPFYYDTAQTLNDRLDDISLPCAMLSVVESGAIADDNGILHERLTCVVMFCNLSDLDFDGIDNETKVLQPLKEKAFKWLISLNRSDDLILETINSTARYYATNDAIISAFAVNVTIVEREGYSFCNL